MEATSAQKKLEWAIRNLRALQAEVDAYTKGRAAYTFHAVPDRRSPQRVDYRCYATEREAPDPDWPLRAGDVIQNLRAALDHLVWASTPENERTTSTAFPIFTDPVRFRVSGAPQCAHVGPDMIETIERSQPFNAWPKDPVIEPLAILHRLSIRDKHLTLATVVGGIEFEGVGLDHPAKLEAWTELATGKTLGPGETYISAFTVTTTASQPSRSSFTTSSSRTVASTFFVRWRCACTRSPRGLRGPVSYESRRVATSAPTPIFRTISKRSVRSTTSSISGSACPWAMTNCVESERMSSYSLRLS